jgi:hypothetical protein
LNDNPLDSLWRRSSDVAFVDDGDRVVLLDLEAPYSPGPELLLGPAAEIWRAMDGATSGQIVRQLMGRFAASRSEVEADTLAFLRSLELRGLAHCQETPSRAD